MSTVDRAIVILWIVRWNSFLRVHSNLSAFLGFTFFLDLFVNVVVWGDILFQKRLISLIVIIYNFLKVWQARLRTVIVVPIPILLIIIFILLLTIDHMLANLLTDTSIILGKLIDLHSLQHTFEFLLQFEVLFTERLGRVRELKDHPLILYRLKLQLPHSFLMTSYFIQQLFYLQWVIIFIHNFIEGLSLVI